MCLKNTATSEILKEISERIDRKEISWGSTYFYDCDKRTFYLRSESEKFELSFTQEAKTENNYTIHRIYKHFEPTLKEIQAERNKEAEKKQLEQQKAIMETLQAELEAKKKKTINIICQ